MLKREGNVAGNFEALDLATNGDWSTGVDSGTTVIYVGGTGDIAVTGKAGGDVIFKAVPVGVLEIDVLTIKQAGTTATDIIVMR